MSRKSAGTQLSIERSLMGMDDSGYRLWIHYTCLFTVFFAAVFSPFILYGRSFLLATDGNSQHLPYLIYSKDWANLILENLKKGKMELPFWSMWIGFGESVLNTVNLYIPTFFYLFFPQHSVNQFFVFQVVIRIYIAGIAFLIYAKKRVKDESALLFGCMIYLFSGYAVYHGPAYPSFLLFLIELPLLLDCIDRIFTGKASGLFIFLVFMEGLNGFYQLYMITIPAVVYALFHYFEIGPEERSSCGGLLKIFLIHVAHYAAGLGLSAVTLLPRFLKALESSRISAESGVNPWHWSLSTYLKYIRGVIDPNIIGYQGIIGLPCIALIAVFYLFYQRKEKLRLVRWNIALYQVVFLIPALTMVFSGLAGRSFRWFFILTFWSALCTAFMLPELLDARGPGKRFCALFFSVYALFYLVSVIWTDTSVSICMLFALAFFVLFFAFAMSDWGHKNRRKVIALIYSMLLIELTIKSYMIYAPQYNDKISSYTDAGRVYAAMQDNASDMLETIEDDNLFRTDAILETRGMRLKQANYGVRNHVNGVSSYNSYLYGTISSYSTKLGNAHQNNKHNILDLDQRTALDALAGVKYAAVFEEGLNRVPYGYEEIGSRVKELSDGTVTTEYLFKNQFALPIAYAYESVMSPDAYDALSPNRKEQAMLQAVVVDESVDMKKAELAFDDQVLYDNEALCAAIADAAKDDANMEYLDGVLLTKKSNCAVTLPIDKVVGEIYVQFRGLHYRPVNFAAMRVKALKQTDATRLEILEAQHSAHTWIPYTAASVTATSGKLTDVAILISTARHYYLGKKDVLLNLGYGKTGKKVKITFSEAGEYTFDSIELICQPMETYPEKISKLQAMQASSIEVDGNDVIVEYDLDKDAFACLAIPYSHDWSVVVDGEKAQLYPANGMYMGVPLSAGKHRLVFTCTMNGFWPGLWISMGTLVVLLAFCAWRIVKRRNMAMADRMKNKTAHCG